MKKIKFNSPVFLLSILQFVSKCAALVRRILIAAFFGASGITDTFFIASTIPEIMTNLLGFQHMKGSITATFSHCKVHDDNQLSIIYSAFLNFILVIGFMFSGLSVLFANQIVKLQAPEFSVPLFIKTVYLTRILMPTLLLIGLSNMLLSILNSLKKFKEPLFAQITMNIISIIFLFIFKGKIGIDSMAWGVLFGWLSAVVFQLIIIHKAGIKYKIWHNSYPAIISKLIKIIAPLLGSMIFAQVNLFFLNRLANSLQPGKLSAMNYSILLISSMVIVAAQPFMTILLPKLSELSALLKDKIAIKLTTQYSKSFILLFIPVSAFVFAHSGLIIRILFMRGAFDLESFNTTSSLLKLASLSLLPWTSSMLFIQYFLSQHKTKIVAIIDGVFATCNIILNFILIRHFDIQGLILGMVLAHWIRFTLLFSSYIILNNSKFSFKFSDFICEKSIISLASYLVFCFGSIYLQKLLHLDSFVSSSLYLMLFALIIHLLYFLILKLFSLHKNLFPSKETTFD